jgi:hypothetical protein
MAAVWRLRKEWLLMTMVVLVMLLQAERCDGALGGLVGRRQLVLVLLVLQQWALRRSSSASPCCWWARCLLVRLQSRAGSRALLRVGVLQPAAWQQHPGHHQPLPLPPQQQQQQQQQPLLLGRE